MILLLFFSHSITAGNGGVYTGDTKVIEPGQKAIIFHNLNEEILVLGTDIEASQKTGLIRFIPFPSEPSVKLASVKTFKAMAGLVKSHELKQLYYTQGSAPLTSNVEIHFSRKLGVHDITVIKINNADQFRTWVNHFFKSKRIPQKKDYPNIEKIVNDYVSRGIKWFVFDYVVAPMLDPRMVDPVEYRFESKTLYYPLITSNTYGYKGSIDLFMVTPYTPCNLFPDCFNLGLGNMQATTSSELRYDELGTILPDAKQFFGNKKIFLQMVQYKGAYDFSKDISYDLSKGTPRAEWVEEESPGVAYNGFNGSEDSSEVSRMETFQPANKLFSAEIPKGWQKMGSNNTQPGEVYRLKLRNDDQTTLEIEKFSGKTITAKQFVHALLNPAVKPPYEDFGKVDSVTLDGQKAVKFKIKTRSYLPAGTSGGSTDVIRKYVVLPRPDGFFVLFMETPLSIAQKHLNLFDAVVNSFEVTLQH